MRGYLRLFLAGPSEQGLERLQSGIGSTGLVGAFVSERAERWGFLRGHGLVRGLLPMGSRVGGGQDGVTCSGGLKVGLRW